MLPIPESFLQNSPSGITATIQKKMIEEWHTALAIYQHRGRLWTRCSAQVWLEARLPLLPNVDWRSSKIDTINLGIRLRIRG